MAEYGTSILIDPVKMRAVAATIEHQRSIIENGLAAIYSDANALKTDWEGKSADAYQAIIRQIGSLQESETLAAHIVSTLREYVADLNAIADKFAATEQQLDAKNEALPSDIFNV